MEVDIFDYVSIGEHAGPRYSLRDTYNTEIRKTAQTRFDLRARNRTGVCDVGRTYVVDDKQTKGVPATTGPVGVRNVCPRKRAINLNGNRSSLNRRWLSRWLAVPFSLPPKTIDRSQALRSLGSRLDFP